MVVFMNTVNDELLEKKFLEIATLVYSEISGNEANETRAISRFKDGNRVVETIKDCSLWQAIDITDFYNKNEKTILEVLKLFVDGGILKIPNLSDKNGPIANPSLAYPGVASHDLLPRLLSPVHYTIEKNCDYSFNQTELISAYRKYYDGWKNKSFLIHIICPLHGVSEVFSEFEIGGFRVVKFDDSLKELVWNHGTQGSNRESTREFCDLQYALYKQKTVGHSDRAMVDDVGKIISSMRLAKEGLIYAANIYEIPELWHRVGGGRHPLSEFDYPVFFINTNEYQLNSQDETDSLLSVYNLLHANRRTEIDFALRRFNLSYSRAHLEDQIIDLVICLECLLLHGKKDELK